jgi:hypothetical protein
MSGTSTGRNNSRPPARASRRYLPWPDRDASVTRKLAEWAAMLAVLGFVMIFMKALGVGPTPGSANLALLTQLKVASIDAAFIAAGACLLAAGIGKAVHRSR